MTRIERFGWRQSVEPGIARVVSSHGDYYHLVCNEREEGETLARKKKSEFRNREQSLMPITGDFVRFRYNERGDSLITEVLPRLSHFERKDPTATRKSQTLAVNFDTLFIMMSLNENFSLARLDRFLALSEDMGEAEAVVLLTKSDLRDGSPDGRILADRPNVKVIPISCVTGEGLDGLAPYMRPCRTIALIGSSGVGKSTLVNHFAGEEWQATQEIQSWSGKGRHTTTSRELIMLPNGVMMIDTPGIREIGQIGERDRILVKGESTHRYRKS